MKNEEWREVKGFPGYKVSNLGRVLSLKTNKLLTPDKTGVSTLGRVFLRKDNKKHTIGVSTLMRENWKWEWIKELDDDEECKECWGFPGYYVTTKGRVFSLHTYQWLNITKGNHYYHQVKVGGRKNNGFKLHTLVGRSFLPYTGSEWVLHNNEELPYPEIHFLSNLRLGNPSENNKDTYEKGRNKVGKGNHPLHKLTPDDVSKIKQHIREGMSNVSISTMFGITPTQVCNIRKNKTWKTIP